MSRDHTVAIFPRARALLAGTALTAALMGGANGVAAEPSGTLTVAWPAVYSFVGMPSQNGGRQGERLVWLGVHETAQRIDADLKVVPNLAESWTVLARWTVAIRSSCARASSSMAAGAR